MDETSRQQPAASSNMRSHEEELADDQSGAAASHQEANGRHPVMGIFFKVWSLVKVTKVRQQKLRRQHSDSAHHQFQYIPGPQLPQNANHYHRQLLQDGHFRRAGSQPAAGPSNRLQVTGKPKAAQTPGTNSTSSGVSSAGSTSAGSTSGGGGVRRHLSAYSLRRSTAEVGPSSPPPPPPPPEAGSSPGAKLAPAKKPSWASKIRRSATSVNQSDFSNYVSRYKFSAANRQQQSQRAPQPPPPQAPSDRLRRLQLLSTGSSREEEEDEEEEDEAEAEEDDDRNREQVGDDEEQHEDHCEGPTASDDDDDDQLGPKSSQGFCRRQRRLEEEDSQDNDIYSTPNDSIQSVPSGTANPIQQQQQPAPGQHHPIVKSFSTSNFSSLLLKQQHLAAASSPPQPLLSHSEEPEEAAQANRAAQEAPAGRLLPAKRANLQGSRFFISSSSSEDSQSAKQQLNNNNNTMAAGCLLTRQTAGASSDSSSHQRHLSPANPVALQLGIHYHAPVARSRQLHAFGSRPDSLMLPATATSPNGVPMLGAELTCLTAQTPGYSQPLLAMLPANRLTARLAARPTSHVLPTDSTRVTMLPSSVSLHDCNYQSASSQGEAKEEPQGGSCEYRLAQMLLESGAKPNAKDASGHTALMLAVMSDNLAAVRCLLERKADLNETNQLGLSALDLVCQKAPSRQRLEMLRLLVEAGAELDRCTSSDSHSPGRLLDRLIRQHQQPQADKLPYIDLLLQSGAKLGSATWLEAHNKQDVQLRLLKKLCQDGYFLYKRSSIEAAVFRFEYALKRIAELEQQLAQQQQLNYYHHHHHHHHLHNHHQSRLIPVAARQIKYQTYLGLSRCERKRRFYKRALEFAHLAILVDSTSYEGFYSKAHILKDLGELDDALLAIYQTARLVEESTELMRLELRQLEQQEESLVFSYPQLDTSLLPAGNASRFESARAELAGNLEYLEEAKRFIGKLKAEILEDKLARSGGERRAASQAAITITN